MATHQGSTNDDHQNELDLRVQQLEESWRSGTVPDLAAILANVEAADRQYFTAECVKVDMEYRWRRGDQVLIEEYLKMWPDVLHNDMAIRELLESECSSRTLFASPPTAEEIQKRFPSVAADIDLRQITESAMTDRADLQRNSDATPAEPDEDTDRGSTKQPPVVLLGERLGRYKIMGRLGGGGQGDVYHAVDTLIARDVALKLLRNSDSKVLERFAREPQFAARVKHKNICPVYDAGTIAGMHFIAMELVEGESIQQRIEKEGPFDIRCAAEIIRDIAGAVAQVHAAGVVHRDIKSGNIMLNSEDAPVLMDFGLARTASETDTLTTTHSFAGTLAFMSPEQARGYVPDYRSDIYSLGAVLYHMLTGSVPFGTLPAEFYIHIGKSQPPNPRRLRGELHRDLDTICRKAMAIRPEDRYKSADEMAEALQRFLDGRPQVASRPGSGRHRRRWIAAIAALLSSAIVGACLLTTEDQIRWIETEGSVHAYAVDESEGRMFVASDPRTKTYPIWEYSLTSGRQLGEPVTFGDHHQHTGLMLSRDRRYLFATNFYFDYISRIGLDGARQPEPIRIIGEEKVMGDAWRWASGFAVNGDGSVAVVPMGQDQRPEPPGGIINDQLAIVDLSRNPPVLVAEVLLQDEPWGYGRCIPPDENAIYLTTSPQPLTDTHKVYRVELTPPYSQESLEIPDGRLQDVEVSTRLNRVFVADPANRRVWVIDRSQFGSGTPKKFCDLEGRAPMDLAIHEDSNLMAVVCSDSRSLHFVDAGNGRELARFDGLRPNCGHVRFSRDGSFVTVACQSMRGGIGVVDVPEFSTKIAFASNRAGGTDQIYTMNVDGADAKPLFNYPSYAHDRHPQWSPTGEHIAFVTDRAPKTHIAVAKHDGTALHIFENSSPRAGGGISWAADGSGIAYVAANGCEIHQLEVSSGKPRQIPCNLPSPHQEIHSVSWETGNSLIIGAMPMRNSVRMELFRVDVATGETTQLTNEQESESHCHLPIVSRGGRIAILRDLVRDGPPDGIYLLHPEKAAEEMFEKLTLDGPPNQLIEMHNWFPNGDKIIFTDLGPRGRFRHLFVLDVNSKTYKQLTSGKFDNGFPDVSPPLPIPSIKAKR